MNSGIPTARTAWLIGLMLGLEIGGVAALRFGPFALAIAIGSCACLALGTFYAVFVGLDSSRRAPK
jgi:hypothetical protein